MLSDLQLFRELLVPRQTGNKCKVPTSPHGTNIPRYGVSDHRDWSFGVGAAQLFIHL